MNTAETVPGIGGPASGDGPLPAPLPPTPPSLSRELGWTALDTFATKGITFGFRLVLAAFLGREQFGIVAMAVLATTVLQMINEFGLSATLIQKRRRELKPEHITTAFTVSTVLALGLVALNLVVVAPFAGTYFREPALVPLLQVAGLSLLCTPFSSVSQALLFKQRNFRWLAVARVSSAALGVAAALWYLWYRPTPFAFAIQLVVTQVTLASLLFLRAHWRPQWRFTRAALQDLMGFSGWVFATDILILLFKNLDQLIIGRLLGASTLALYALAFQLTDMIRMNLMSIMNRVMFVHYAEIQDDLGAVRIQYLRTLSWNLALVAPTMVFIACSGPVLLPWILGPEWAGSGPLLQILALGVVLHVAGGSTSIVFKALGRPKLDLTLFTINTVLIALPLLLLGATQAGAIGVAGALVVAKVTSMVMRQACMKRLTHLETRAFLGTSLRGLLPGLVLVLPGAALVRYDGDYALAAHLAFGVLTAVLVLVSLKRTRRPRR